MQAHVELGRLYKTKVDRVDVLYIYKCTKHYKDISMDRSWDNFENQLKFQEVS